MNEKFLTLAKLVRENERTLNYNFSLKQYNENMFSRICLKQR